MTYRIGTRRSALAKVQTQMVADKLKSSGLQVKIIEIASEGDQDRSLPLYEVEAESPGLFTKHLEKALQENVIDLAVHSLKDLPTTVAQGLQVAAVLERENPADCLVISPKAFDPSQTLPVKRGAMVGTSSLRREAELLAQRSDLRVVPIRGNVPTRIKIVEDGKCDAVILARAGVKRLGLSFGALQCVDLDLKNFVPAPAQGAIAVETREVIPDELQRALAPLHCPKTETAVRIERKILQELHGGCTLPLGVHCTVGEGQLHVCAFLGISKDRADRKHEWVDFKKVELCESQEAVLVQQVIGRLG